MKFKFLVLFAILVNIQIVGYTQRVRAVGTGDDSQLIVDCTGMNPSCYDTESKGYTEAQLKTEAADKMLYKTFEVEKNISSSEYTQQQGYTRCSTLSINGRNGWRMPTSKELRLIRLLYKPLIGLGMKLTGSGYFFIHSATESLIQAEASLTTAFYGFNFNEEFRQFASNGMFETEKSMIICIREIHK